MRRELFNAVTVFVGENCPRVGEARPSRSGFGGREGEVTDAMLEMLAPRRDTAGAVTVRLIDGALVREGVVGETGGRAAENVTNVSSSRDAITFSRPR